MDTRISLIPYPQHLVQSEGALELPAAGCTLISDPFFAKEIALACRMLSEAGVACVPAGTADGTCPPIEIRKTDGTGGEEACRIEITGSRISISASAPCGAFYGIQTLRQLFITYGHTIPCLIIEDKPAYQWRGFLLDTSRSFYSVAFIKKIIDISAFHKLNRFHWHLTDDQGWRLPVPEYPLLTEKGSKRWDCNVPVCDDSEENRKRKFYTEAEIREIVSYAAERHITVVPEVELPGHASALLASYPQFGCTGGPYRVESCWGIFPDVICAGNDDIFKLYGCIFDTLCRLFPGRWIHIGGDECVTDRWEHCPKCQARIKQQGLDSPAQLQSWITSRMAQMVLDRGRIPIGWDEVLDNTEKAPLPQQVVVQSWRGTEGGMSAAQKGHYAIMSPQTMCYMNLQNYDSPEEPGRLGIITAEEAYGFTPGDSPFMLGGEGALWSEELPSSRVAEYMLFPRFCAIAESLWLPAGKKDFSLFQENWTEHKKRLSQMGFLYYDGKLK